MKNTAKYLLIFTLIISAARNQVAFCMHPESVSTEIINELRKEEVCRRDDRLGDLSILPNEILINICERLKTEELNSLSRVSKISNELVNFYLELPITESNRTISFTVGNNKTSSLNSFNSSLNIIQEKMLKFINKTDRTLTINFKHPFKTNEKLIFFNPIQKMRCEKKQSESLTFDRNSINQLKDAVLHNSITGKDITCSIILDNKKTIIFLAKLFLEELIEQMPQL